MATTWDLELYVRFRNLRAPIQVFEDAVDLFSGAGTSTSTSSPASSGFGCYGFFIATILGVGLGLLIGWFRVAEDMLFPPIELLRPIPAVAWVPLSIMLWPTERASIVFITSLGAFFPIVLNTIHGVEAIDRQLVRAARSLGAGSRCHLS